MIERAGVPVGEAFRGEWLAAYAVVEGADGYRVVFSVAELDEGYGRDDVLVAHELDGKPLPQGDGRFQLVKLSDDRKGRWVRQVRSITIRKAAP